MGIVIARNTARLYVTDVRSLSADKSRVVDCLSLQTVVAAFAVVTVG